MLRADVAALLRLAGAHEMHHRLQKLLLMLHNSFSHSNKREILKGALPPV